MRILYCNKYSFPFSGTEKYLFDLMDLMKSQGHEVALFSADDLEEGPQNSNPTFATQGLFQKAKIGLRAVYSWKARRALRRVIREFKPDVVHIRNIYHLLSPSILAELKAHKIPVLYHLNDFKILCPSYNLVSHGNACERCKSGQFWHVVTEGCYAGGRVASVALAAEAYTHKWLGSYQNCVDRFIAPSEFVKQKLIEHGWNGRKIEVLPHFQKLSADVSVPQEDAPILYFGRLSAEKGITDLLAAMRQLPNVKLQIAGEGPLRTALEQEVATFEMKNVQFLGHMQGKSLEQVIATARFTVFPTRAYETFGKSIVESYACARAVVASDLGSRRELVHEGKTGLLYPVGDSAKLAEAISWLIAHPEIATEMGATGRKLVEKNYAPKQHYKNLLKLYQDLTPRKATVVSIPSQRRLRVAFIGGRGVIAKYSGIETYYEEMGKCLAAKGLEVTVYCRNYFTPDLRTYRGMNIVRLPAFRSKHLETVLHTFLSTIHAMFGRNDIIHFHATGPALFSFLPRLMGKKTAVTVQGLDWQRKKWGRLAAFVLRLGEAAAVRLPNETMVVSRSLRDFYRARYERETHYIPNGTSERKCSSSSTLEHFGLQKQRYILFLGRFSPEKNCHLLIEAFSRIQTPFKLVMAGGSSHSDGYVTELRERAKENKNIVLLDWLSGKELDEVLGNAALFVLPSDLEGMSLALLDAMGAGVCVLVSDVPENKELVDNAGFTFARGNTSDLERMLRFLLANPVLRREKALLAQRKIEHGFLWPGIADEVEAVYRAMVGETIQAAPVLVPSAPLANRKIAA